MEKVVLENILWLLYVQRKWKRSTEEKSVAHGQRCTTATWYHYEIRLCLFPALVEKEVTTCCDEWVFAEMTTTREPYRLKVYANGKCFAEVEGIEVMQLYQTLDSQQHSEEKKNHHSPIS